MIRHLEAIHSFALEQPLPIACLRSEVIALLQHLTSARGRTDANCRATDHQIMNDESLWERADEIEAIDPALASVLADMGGALHDTVSHPVVAENFESTPELLLARLNSPS